MKLKNIFAKHMLVADGMRLPVSRRFCYTTFGVRGRYDNIARTGNYICSGTPGTGFFARSSDSHSYRKFVNDKRKKLDGNLFTRIFLIGPSFEKEHKLIEAAFEHTEDKNVRRVLDSYQNVIALARKEEELQRIVRAVKDKIGNHPRKHLVSVLSHYKSSIATLEHDVKSVQINVTKDFDEQKLASWNKVIEAFHELIECRRIWSVYNENGLEAYEQVFFDMGIFDFIQSKYDTPVMRDYRGIHYYIYPKGIIVARSTVDFDCKTWDQLEMKFGVVDTSVLAVRPQLNSYHRSSGMRHHDALSNLYGATRAQVVGEITIPELDLRFFVNRADKAEAFVNALNDFVKA